MKKTFVGFGFGPIQSGLFLHEAARSGHFARLVVAEVDAIMVDALRRAGGYFEINIARTDGIARERIGPVEILNPSRAEDRRTLIDELADADEISTALPSVAFYTKGGRASPARLLREAFRMQAKPRIVYTAENDTRAAEHLEMSVGRSRGVQFLNTVIGKMSGTMTDPSERRRLRLASLVPGSDRAVLVESFNRILISRVALPHFRRGIPVFKEKDDLQPFEEAKLYGHNAVHALLGYSARRLGCRFISDAPLSLVAYAREAFIEECGRALIQRHAGKDPLFTTTGFRGYVDDLMERMVNPWLRDSVDRVTRDPLRKLGWNDRVIGTLRIALDAGLVPHRMARAAGLAYAQAQGEHPDLRWSTIWPGPDRPRGRKQELQDLIQSFT